MYLFHLLVLLNPHFNCSKKLLSSFVDKVTTGTYYLVSVILNVAFVGASILSFAFTGESALGSVFPNVCVVISVKTQFSEHVKVNHTSQLIKGMSKVLQKLLKYLNGETISNFFLVFISPCSVP